MYDTLLITRMAISGSEQAKDSTVLQPKVSCIMGIFKQLQGYDDDVHGRMEKAILLSVAQRFKFNVCKQRRNLRGLFRILRLCTSVRLISQGQFSIGDFVIY